MATELEMAHSEIRDSLLEEMKSILASEDSSVGSRRVVRVRRDCPEIDLVRWLAAQASGERVYWSERDGSFVVSGLGAASLVTSESPDDTHALFERMRGDLSPESDGLRYYGGFRFDMGKPTSQQWQPFGAYRFILPEIELGRNGDQYYVACNVVLPDSARDLDRRAGLIEGLSGVTFDGDTSSADLPDVIERHDTPSLNDWRSSISELLEAFAENQVEKVVLARESNFALSDKIEPLTLFRTLMDETSYSYHYCFQSQNGPAFIGASPERLYKRTGTSLESEALAGTRPRGETREEDNLLGQELMSSKKETQEHRYVAESILEQFGKYCSTVRRNGGTELLLLRHCQHLLSRIEGTLDRNDRDPDLLKGLHPTPAVGGTPRDIALKRIASMEAFDRGWYTGPVGWIGHDSAEFAVAIRSALVNGKTVSVFAGAGIVPGSDPDQEWDELESKIADFSAILDRVTAPRRALQG